MAKVNISFDTVSKDLEVTLDGEAVANVESLSLSKAGGYYYSEDEAAKGFSFCLLTLDKKAEQGYKTYTQIVAKQSEEGRRAEAAGAGTFDKNSEFLALKGLTNLSKEIGNILKGKRIR